MSAGMCAVKTVRFESLNLTHYQVWTDEKCVYDNASRERCADWATAQGYEIVSLGELHAAYDAEHLPRPESDEDRASREHYDAGIIMRGPGRL